MEIHINAQTTNKENILNRIKELRIMAEELTTSDLQGIAMVIAMDIDKNKILKLREITLNNKQKAFLYKQYASIKSERRF